MVKVLIILGGGIKDNELNESTLIRYTEALKISKNYDFIICSSDRTYRPEGLLHKFSEAKIGSDYLIENGVDVNKIILEDKSRDTFSNAYYCRLITDENKYFDIDILTSDFHMEKTKFVFNFVFSNEIYNLNFISVENPKNSISLNNRIISEMEVVKFYKKYLFGHYGVKKYDLNSIKYFIDNYNFATSGNKDQLQCELSNIIKEKISSTELLY